MTSCTLKYAHGKLLDRMRQNPLPTKLSSSSSSVGTSTFSKAMLRTVIVFSVQTQIWGRVDDLLVVIVLALCYSFILFIQLASLMRIRRVCVVV